jgi:hypothetical protein
VGALLGAVVMPATVWAGVQHFDPLCDGGGGGETGIACAMKSLMLTAPRLSRSACWPAS